MSPQENHDPLSELFTDALIPPADPLRREAIFAETRAVLGRRRLVRRGLWTAALAASYVVGVFSVLGWQSVHPGKELAGQSVNPAGTPSQPAPAESKMSAPQPTGPTSEMPNVVAASKPVETLSTFEKLRRAGDRQLNERGNLQGAIGCYGRALDFASDDELQIVPERDSWLLIPLKETRLEARKHVHKKS